MVIVKLVEEDEEEEASEDGGNVVEPEGIPLTRPPTAGAGDGEGMGKEGLVEEEEDEEPDTSRFSNWLVFRKTYLNGASEPRSIRWIFTSPGLIHIMRFRVWAKIFSAGSIPAPLAAFSIRLSRRWSKEMDR